MLIHPKMMKNVFLFCVCGILLAACTRNLSHNEGFVTRLGNDTLAVETFSETPYGFEAIVVLRSPKTSVTRYNIAFGNDGGIKEMVGLTLQDGGITEGRYQKIFSASKVGDSLNVVQIAQSGTEHSMMVEYEEGVLPFIDMVHWPFELALRKAAKSEVDSVHQNMLSGRSIADFILADVGNNHWTIRHPSRGVMDVQVDDKGHLITLDAAQTTRKLVVTRAMNIPIQQIATKFVQQDEAGTAFGGLSGAVTQQFNIKNATFEVEYGSPAKRGRELFGGIVPFGERWRTGANRATHFSTSVDISLGGLTVPAGQYTLFSIPERDGGTLIINKQTGQNGRSYDPTRDLGRVEMKRVHQDIETENFTITITESGANASLNLVWGNTAYSVPIKIL